MAIFRPRIFGARSAEISFGVFLTVFDETNPFFALAVQVATVRRVGVRAGPVGLVVGD